MIRSIWTILFTLLLICFFSSAYGGTEHQKVQTDLIKEKCTKCHDAARAQKIHETGKSGVIVKCCV